MKPAAAREPAAWPNPCTTDHPVIRLDGGNRPRRSRGCSADFCELVKARLTTLMLVTTLAGFYMGWSGPMDWLRLFNTLFGTALVAGGAAALNELIERRADAAMHRTRGRPLPAGRMSPDTALLIGFGLAASGLFTCSSWSIASPRRWRR